MIKFLISIFIILSCLSGLSHAEIEPLFLSKEVVKRLDRVPEFKFIIDEANKLGVQVYLFGGTAAGFAHYVRWDLERETGDTKYQKERFDYDFTNIYHGNQDLDIVVDGDHDAVLKLKRALIKKYPHFMGSKDAWEVRSLRKQHGDKLPLLNNKEFLNQHSDTNSTGLLSLNGKEGDPVFRDLMDWENRESDFLKDVAAGKIRYIYNNKHKATKRFRKGLNPAVLSAIRYLAKLTQYELIGTDEDLDLVTKIISEQNFSKLSAYGKKKAEEFGLKVLLNSPNIEYASNLLDRTGLRQKLISMNKKGSSSKNSLIWWMNKEPLRSNRISAKGKKAYEIFQADPQGNIIVSHETESFTAYESIVKSADGHANVFISRKNKLGEVAAYGNGFYTKVGSEGARGTGFTVRFKLDPEAIEGKDFKYLKKYNFVVIKNKKILKVIQDDIDLDLIELFELLKAGVIGAQDKGLLEKLSRKFARRGVSDNEIAYLEEDLEQTEWNEENNFALAFWFKSNLFKKKPSLVHIFLKHAVFSKDNVFKYLFVLDYKVSEFLRDEIYDHFSNLDFEEIYKELSFLRDPVKLNHLHLLIAVFKTYQSADKFSEKTVDELDKFVAYLLREISYGYDKGEFFLLTKNEKKEIKKIADFVVRRVKSSPHFNDDYGLMFYSALTLKSFWGRLKHFAYSPISASVSASLLISIMMTAYFNLVLPEGIFIGPLSFVDYFIYGILYLNAGLLLNQFNKGPFKITTSRALFVKEIKRMWKMNKTGADSIVDVSSISCGSYLN